jgi:23S rRNA pseudouridine1911/1915/1917 synthase
LCDSQAIIHEDNHIVVIIKRQGDLVDDIAAELKKTRGYIATVHRLDQVTGGVIVFAKSSKAAARLSEQIAAHKFTKMYLAVVIGVPKKRQDTLVNYLYKNEGKNIVEVVPMATSGAKRAELSYELLPKPPKDKHQNICLLKINLATGRTHQIRVQLSHIGCPIFGDAKYGGDTLGKGWDIALWAHELAFVHPTTEETLRFIVNPPETVPWTSFDFDRRAHGGK